jgi:hypothetical protein
MEQLNRYDYVVYENFIEKYPYLKEKLNQIILEYTEWSNGLYKLCVKECCYFPKYKLPYTGSWSVDEPGSRHPRCTTWEKFENQMGTTWRKFDLTQFDIDIDECFLIGNFFNEIGHKVILVTFTHWRIGYDFKFENLRHIYRIEDIEMPSKNNEIHSVHICISLY